MADAPVGLSDAKIRATLAVIQANGEINNVPQPQLDLILEKARKELLFKPATPVTPP